jgi:hypothetical protein
MALRRVDDFLGNPVEFTQGWSFSGVESRSDAEKDELARQALEGKCRQWVLERQAAGQALQFDHVQLIANRNGWSDTDQDWRGVRTHKCGGLGVGYLFVNV